ncbi:MAG: RNA polymerase sigma factor [Opitutae bacterium]|nr:RNA polymerase sigma factor [Opitutae bacterium]
MNPSHRQLEALYRETGANLLAYFRGRPTLAPQAEDLLQETFARALQNPERLTAALSPRAYLFGIARHVGHDALRRSQVAVALTDDEPLVGEVEDARLADMREAVAQLPPAQRETLLLKLRHDLSYEKIAEALEIPIGTVRSRLHAAVHSLRATLNPPSPTRP